MRVSSVRAAPVAASTPGTEPLRPFSTSSPYLLGGFSRTGRRHRGSPGAASDLQGVVGVGPAEADGGVTRLDEVAVGRVDLDAGEHGDVGVAPGVHPGGG